MSNLWPDKFVARMQALLGSDYEAFVEAGKLPLRRGLRVNTLKCDIDKFISISPLLLQPAPFAAGSFYVEGEHKAGADPLHHAGAYYMQEPSAMSAVTVLNPQPGERVLDVCAAPGGKSTQIAAALAGQGLLWSNEYVHARAQILMQNLERCGVANAVVSNMDVPRLCAGLTGFFDAVLVDAPCSGEGMFRKEPAALEQWSENNIQLCAQRQKEILHAAALSVRSGGRLVYSTCTFAPEENECMVAWFLHEHPAYELIDIEKTGVHFGQPAFDWSRVENFAEWDRPTGGDIPLSYCRRVLPVHSGEGHFLALFRRKEGETGTTHAYTYPKPDTNSKMSEELYGKCFTKPASGCFCSFGEAVRLLPEGLPQLQGLGVLSAGFIATEVCKNRVEPSHTLFMTANSNERCVSSANLPLSDSRLTDFLRGQEITVEDAQGWTAVAVEGVVTGFGKASNGVLKNRYPKGLRLR